MPEPSSPRRAPSTPDRRGLAPLAAAGLLLLLVATVSPGAAEIRADHDKSRDFATYASFSFGSVSSLPSGELTELLRRTVAAELEAAGLEPADAGGDLTVHLWAVAADGAWLDVDNALGYGRLGWPGWGDWGPTAVNIRRLGPGSLMVDLYDPAADRPVWRGIAEDLLTKIPKKQARLEKKLSKAVGEMFDAFPPG